MFRSRLLLLASVLGIGALASCSFAKHSHEHDISASLDEDGNLVIPYDEALGEAPEEGFTEGRVLVKSAPVLEKKLLGDLSACHTESLYEGSLWHIVNLPHGEDTTKAVSYLRNLGNFDAVDYDYSMAATAEIESVDISGNEYSDRLPYIESQGIGYAWGHQKHQTGSEDLAGGSRDVIVAIIDTGIDYNHLDLRDNIWTNPGEIPNNGIDDDQNGFVDDVRGWDFVGNDNDPIDDNGHGTHVAGIVAARNNNIGTVGVAYNCKVMAIKAANSSGMLNNTNIARAINYAYMNGASVINMSFGGSSITMAVEDALQEAYNQCVLVASAGNNGLCNTIECPEHEPRCGVSYPAALPYVLGVMSCDASGSALSPFTNYDHYPYDSIEYETYACGASVYSSWPNNKIACLSGTSMAAPVVSGIAALLRSAYPDRNAYSNKYINSQITNTGSLHPGAVIGDGYHSFANAYDALTKIPTPHIYSVYNYYAIDSEAYSPLNNGDGFIDAGETVKIGIEFMNRGGKASNIHVQADTIRNNDPDLVDPYITFEASEFDMADIGTYSIGTGGKTYTDGLVSDVENGLLVHVSPDTPNQYNCVINIHVTYKNGLDPNDNTLYRGDTTISITVSRGFRLPAIITEDITFTSDKLYIIGENLTVAENATVVFEEGCQVQVYDDLDSEVSGNTEVEIKSYGNILFQGSQTNPVVIGPSENHLSKSFAITSSRITFSYCKIHNMTTKGDTKLNIDHCRLQYEKNAPGSGRLYFYLGSNVSNNEFRGYTSITSYGSGTFENNLFMDSGVSRSYSGGTYLNNVFLDTPYYRGIAAVADLNVGTFNNNVLMQDYVTNDLESKSILKFDVKSYWPNASGNIGRDLYATYTSRLVANNVASTGLPIIDLTDYEHHDPDLVWPYVDDIQLYIDNEEVNSVSKGDNVTARMTFSTALDTNIPVSLFYGSTEPYADYRVEGDFVSPTVWEGTFTVAALIEGGTQRFRVSGGAKADDTFKTLINNGATLGFEIDSSKSMSMDLQADPQEDGVHLSWVQDDYETLMGYNIYRSEDKDGNYTKLNSTIIPENENTFLDENAEPGKAYWYTFTVVFSDLSESIPAGKVTCRTLDTLPPNVYHTPVNQGYLGNNLIISATASDNVGIVSATLYYRTVGESTYKSVSMLRQSDRYVGTIFGSELSLDGLEYYMVFSDGYGETYKGSAEAPYSVIIKDSSALSMMGDVDGDGIVSTKDALMLMQAIEGDRILTDDQFQRADLNHSGVLEAVEALRILQYVNGKINTLEM